MACSVPDVTGNHYEFLVSGMAFGAALMLAGVYSPHVIIDQMKLKNFQMLVVFLNASAISSIVIYNFRKHKPNIWHPRKPATLGSRTYDGNLIGGALLGAGMALTGACPGTLLPQLAAGVPSGKYVLAGGLLGGIIYSKFRTLFRTPSEPQLTDATAKPTVYERMGVREVNGMLCFMVFCIAVAEGVRAIIPGQDKNLLSRATLGGYAVGASQALSMWLTGNTLGVSAAYEEFGDWFWWLLSSGSNQCPNGKKLAFPVSSVLGALIYRALIDIPAPVAVNVGALKAVLGGMMMIVGGRIGGGCTSGHGISGMSMLSIASFVSVASMFGTGIVVALLMG